MELEAVNLRPESNRVDVGKDELRIIVGGEVRWQMGVALPTTRTFASQIH